MNESIVDIIYGYVDEIKSKITSIDSSKLCEDLSYSPEELSDLIQNPVYNASIYLEILEYIDKQLERS